MQSFLGSVLFFKDFIPNFAEYAAPLHDMTHKNFDWNQENWTVDYNAAFEKIKEAVQCSMQLYFPDYTKPWTMRSDASEIACGAVLFQIEEGVDGNIYQLIGCASTKFSSSASSWDIHKKEAFAMYYGFKQFAYYLRGKEFIVQTDHSNLTYIGDNLTPIVVRWRIFMQSFTFMVQRILGSKMGLADYLSRMYVEYDPASLLTIEEQQDDVVGLMLLQTIMATELLDNHENQLMEINDILQEEEMKNET
jgi:hypothetical protein